MTFRRKQRLFFIDDQVPKQWKHIPYKYNILFLKQNYSIIFHNSTVNIFQFIALIYQMTVKWQDIYQYCVIWMNITWIIPTRRVSEVATAIGVKEVDETWANELLLKAVSCVFFGSPGT